MWMRMLLCAFIRPCPGRERGKDNLFPTRAPCGPQPRPEPSPHSVCCFRADLKLSLLCGKIKKDSAKSSRKRKSEGRSDILRMVQRTKNDAARARRSSLSKHTSQPTDPPRTASLWSSICKQLRHKHTPNGKYTSNYFESRYFRTCVICLTLF